MRKMAITCRTIANGVKLATCRLGNGERIHIVFRGTRDIAGRIADRLTRRAA